MTSATWKMPDPPWCLFLDHLGECESCRPPPRRRKESKAQRKEREAWRWDAGGCKPAHTILLALEAARNRR